jgi:opine dehydrogenase
MPVRVAVLGAGHGAHAHAGHLALAGHEVRLCHLPSRAASLAAARVTGGVDVATDADPSRVPSGRATLHRVTTDFGEALHGADAVLLVVAAEGQEAFIRAIGPHLSRGQVLLLCPGKFGALPARRMLDGWAGAREAIVAESESLLYIARLEGPAAVRIKGIKTRLAVAAVPAPRTAQALDVLCRLHPEFAPATDVLETSLADPGNVMHPVHTLMNTGRIEESGPYRYDHYGVTASIGRTIDALDRERVAVGAALGLSIPTVPQRLAAAYGADASGAAAAIRSTVGYRGFMAPGDLAHRFVTENVPYGLVPIAALGRQVGVATPAIDAIVELAHAATGRDFRAQGRGIDGLGLRGMSAVQIVERVR